MAESIELIKKLRDATGSGINTIREAIRETGGDEAEAMAYLRRKGIDKAQKRSAKETNNGIIGTYFHGNGQLGVLVEINTETDFAARSEDIQKFANDMALQVAAVNPMFISKESVDAQVLEQEKEGYLKELEGKPEEIKAKILEGKLDKFYKENVLLEQQLFTDESKTVQDYISDLVAKVGEKIIVKRFVKFTVAKDPVTA